MSGGGYDISSSVSESATQGSSIVSPFNVGGGIKIPDAAWYLAAALVAFWLYKKFSK